MPNLKLHLDADASHKTLHRVLLERGHDVTRMPTPWMPLDADDKAQLLGATAQGRILFTYNIADFMPLAIQYPQHGGLVLAAQTSWTLFALIASLDRMLQEPSTVHWLGQVRWLNDWRTAQ